MENVKEKFVDIQPISKGRRILVFLGDFFINFIIAMFLFNVVIYPIGQAVSSYNDRMIEVEEAESLRNSILYENGLLFYETQEEIDMFNYNLTYTYDLYLRYYVFEDEDDLQYEVIYTYFNNIIGDHDLYINLYKDVNSSYNFFDITDDSVVLKDYYKSLLSAYFDPSDALNSEGETYYETLCNNVFLFLYSEVLLNMQENNVLNYDLYQNVVDDVNTYIDILITICAYITFMLSSSICYILYPLISKSGKTIAMSMMRIERVSVKTLNILKRPIRLINALYLFALNFVYIMFLPSFIVSFNYLFSVGGLFIVSVISLFLVIVSGIFLLINSFGMTLFDFIGQSVLISNDSLNELIRVKGISND